MKYCAIISLFLLLFHSINGQNLIPNASFERTNYCEANIPCSPSAWYSVSNYPFGYENDLAQSIDGKHSLAFLIASGEGIRSYWQTMLLCKLKRGVEYSISFDVLPFNGNFNPDYFGIYFPDTFIRSKKDTIIQLKGSNYLPKGNQSTLKNGWIKTTTFFKATGEETFLLMGNFSSLSNNEILERLPGKSKFIGYYIDNIFLKSTDKTNKICPDYNQRMDSLYAENIRHKKIIQVAKVFSSGKTDSLSFYPDKDTIQLGNIHFGFDSDVLRNTLELDNYFKTLNKEKITEISIMGYTDSIGNKKYNQDLSERRAFSVKKYLIDKLGLNAEIILTTGKGMSTENAQFQLNRKVEVIISKSKIVTK